MLSKGTPKKIIEMYEKYGWQLRRVLLTDEARKDLAEVFDPEKIVSADINALWFSRAAQNGGETWELRHLSETPYALLEVFEEGEDEEVKQERLIEIQDTLRQTILKV